MPENKNRRIVLAARPKGEPADTDFRMESVDIPAPAEGQLLLRNLFISLDPYMRGRMNAGPSYAACVEIGQVMEGGAVSEVVESRAEGFHPGDVVLSYTGWQEYAVADPRGLRRLDPNLAPVSTALGVLGMPGMTAYTGLLNIGKPQPGETVVVAAAAGAVGAIVGQIAKLKGCHVVGIAGGEAKCKYVREELGFDACLDHRAPTLGKDLAAACPKGIDVYFENVGGAVFEAVFPLLNNFSRVPVCGLISQYSATRLPEGPNRVPLLMGAILTKRITFRGFIVTDYQSQHEEFQREMAAWVKQGAVKYREDIVDGLDNAVAAFQGLLKGKNFGKLLVRLK
jgi:NADPH-dependent curcumin reductase